MTDADLQMIEEAVARAVSPLERKVDLLRLLYGQTTLTKKQAADYCGVTTRTIDRKVESGEIVPVPGTKRRFTLALLDKALRDGVFSRSAKRLSTA